MRSQQKAAAISCSIVFLFLIACASAVYADRGMSGLSEFTPASGPTILSPTTDNVNLAGKDSLEFRWEGSRAIRTESYQFKLYKGYHTTAAALFLKKTISKAVDSLSVPASQFEIGQVYTWVLTQVFLGGAKATPSASSFKIIKK